MDSFGVIPVSSGTKIRHSFTLQTYLKFNSSTATGKSFPLFLWANEDVGIYSSIYIVRTASLIDLPEVVLYMVYNTLCMMYFIFNHKLYMIYNILYALAYLQQVRIRNSCYKNSK